MEGQFVKNDSPVLKVVRPILQAAIYSRPQFVPVKMGEYWYDGSQWNWHEGSEEGRH